MYNPELLYVEANLEETRLPGVAPGNPVRIEIDAFAEPFRGRVVWINKSTGAQFALMPRNVVSGEFTRVVQRVPVRIRIERDDRWPHAPRRAVGAGGHRPRAGRPGLGREGGPASWPEYETRYNRPAPDGAGTVQPRARPRCRQTIARDRTADRRGTGPRRSAGATSWPPWRSSWSWSRSTRPSS